jgi:hypothetical protein
MAVVYERLRVHESVLGETRTGDGDGASNSRLSREHTITCQPCSAVYAIFALFLPRSVMPSWAAPLRYPPSQYLELQGSTAFSTTDAVPSLAIRHCAGERITPVT